MFVCVIKFRSHNYYYIYGSCYTFICILRREGIKPGTERNGTGKLKLIIIIIQLNNFKSVVIGSKTEEDTVIITKEKTRLL